MYEKMVFSSQIRKNMFHLILNFVRIAFRLSYLVSFKRKRNEVLTLLPCEKAELFSFHFHKARQGKEGKEWLPNGNEGIWGCSTSIPSTCTCSR